MVLSLVAECMKKGAKAVCLISGITKET